MLDALEAVAIARQNAVSRGISWKGAIQTRLRESYLRDGVTENSPAWFVNTNVLRDGRNFMALIDAETGEIIETTWRSTPNGKKRARPESK